MRVLTTTLEMILKALFFSTQNTCVIYKHRASYGQAFFGKALIEVFCQKKFPSKQTFLINRKFIYHRIIILSVFLLLFMAASFSAQADQIAQIKTSQKKNAQAAIPTKDITQISKASQCSVYNISLEQQNAPSKLITASSHSTNNVVNKADLPKQHSYRIIKRLPHDEQAFTQGLAFHENTLYESIGLLGRSQIRKLDSKSGKVKQRRKLGRYYFGEGISIVDDQIIQLTLSTENVFIYDIKNLTLIDSYKFSGEGWGITNIGKQLLISDGSNRLKWLNNKQGRLKDIYVNENGIAVQGLNELEYANGFIYANVWPGDCVAQINPSNGNVEAWINLSGLYQQEKRPHWSAVLNGLAYKKETDTFYVTGKYWPYIYELTFVTKKPAEKKKDAASLKVSLN